MLRRSGIRTRLIHSGQRARNPIPIATGRSVTTKSCATVRASGRRTAWPPVIVSAEKRSIPALIQSLATVRGSNFCDVAAFADERNGNLILLSTLDNLGKGASGQAVQCANLMSGFAEDAGLLGAPLVL